MKTPSLTLSQAFSEAVSKFTQLNGRSRRSEYWWVAGIRMLAGVVCSPVAGVVLGALMVPLAVRRLHDTGRSGWRLIWNWAALVALFLIGSCFALVVVTDYMCVPIADAICSGRDGLDAMLIVGWEALCDASLPALLAKYQVFFAVYAVLLAAYWVYTTFIFMWMCQDSTPQPNKYGESPKYVHGHSAPASAQT